MPRKEVSPRLLASAGGFNDEETNLVREDGVGSGEIALPEEEEEITGGGETTSFLLFFTNFQLFLSTSSPQLIFKSLHGLFFFFVFFLLFVRSFSTVGTHPDSHLTK